MTYEEAKDRLAEIEAGVDAFSAALQTFPKGAMGLTSDAAKATPEWRAAQSGFNNCFAMLRTFNAYFLKEFRTEIAAERDAARRVA